MNELTEYIDNALLYSPKSIYLIIALIDNYKKNIIPVLNKRDKCNNKCYTFFENNSLQFFRNILDSNNDDLDNIFYKYVFERSKVDINIKNIDELVSTIECSNCRSLYETVSKNDISTFMIKFYKRYGKRPNYFFDTVRACIDVYEGNILSIKKLKKNIKKIILENQMLLYGHSVFDDYINNVIYMINSNINLELIINNLFYPIIKIDQFRTGGRNNIILETYRKEIILIVSSSILIETIIFKYETLIMKQCPETKSISIYSDYYNHNECLIIQDEYLRKELTFIENKRMKPKYIIQRFIDLENMLKSYWTFNKVIPINYADTVFYNIPRSYYVEQLSNILISDIATIIIDYINVPQKYVGLYNNDLNAIFYKN